MGFVHVAHEGLITELGLELNQRGDVAVNNFQTSQPWVFAAGDTINGASLVVRAIDSGRAAAEAIDQWLKDNN
jgi:glutamate synthase (NADPH/NADH) small chain